MIFVMELLNMNECNMYGGRGGGGGDVFENTCVILLFLNTHSP